MISRIDCLIRPLVTAWGHDQATESRHGHAQRRPGRRDPAHESQARPRPRARRQAPGGPRRAALAVRARATRGTPRRGTQGPPAHHRRTQRPQPPAGPHPLAAGGGPDGRGDARRRRPGAGGDHHPCVGRAAWPRGRRPGPGGHQVHRSDGGQVILRRAPRARRIAPALALALALAGLAVAIGPAVAATPPATLTVFAAASLAEPFTELARMLERQQPGLVVLLNLAGSQQLAAQIEQGARADLFASADARWMAYLATRDLLDGAPRLFARNRLVIIVPRTNPARIGR